MMRPLLKEPKKEKLRFASGFYRGEPFEIEVATHENIISLKSHMEATIGHGAMTDVKWFWREQE